ncbi:hypothetical protein ACFTXM_48035 [Streptomyces sp. NPDC056930]|uniref:hypothetical protein n=1 Tax=Streptomyces sp. NPDC056930 TaxID=3345967 RepID=UPI00362C3AF5
MRAASVLSELMVRAPWRRTGTARQLHDEVLAARPEFAKANSSPSGSTPSAKTTCPASAPSLRATIATLSSPA